MKKIILSCFTIASMMWTAPAFCSSMIHDLSQGNLTLDDKTIDAVAALVTYYANSTMKSNR